MLVKKEKFSPRYYSFAVWSLAQNKKLPGGSFLKDYFFLFATFFFFFGATFFFFKTFFFLCSLALAIQLQLHIIKFLRAIFKHPLGVSP